MFMNGAHNLLHFALIEYSARIVHIFFLILTTHPLAFHPTYKHECKRFNSNFLAHKFHPNINILMEVGRKCVCNFRWNSIFRTQTSHLLGYFILVLCALHTRDLGKIAMCTVVWNWIATRNSMKFVRNFPSTVLINRLFHMYRWI